MAELAYTHVVAETQVATPAVVTPANKAPQSPVPIPLLEKEHSSGEDRQGASADEARAPEPKVSRLHCPKLIADIQRHVSARHAEPPSLRQRTGAALSRTQVDIRALQQAAGRLPAGVEPVVGQAGGVLDGSTSNAIRSRIGAGRPLDRPVLQRMQTAFAADLSGVRIHTDSSATVLNRMVSARAFTTGNDIFFGSGEYAPDTPVGERVLAHELAHTLQRSTVARRTDAGAATAIGPAVPKTTPPRLVRRSTALAAEKPVDGSPDKTAARIATPPLQPMMERLLETLDKKTLATVTRNKTVALAWVVEPDDPAPRLVYTTSNHWKNPSLERALAQLGAERWHEAERAAKGDRGPKGAPGDAEQLLLDIAWEADYRVVDLAVSRQMCSACAKAVDDYRDEHGALSVFEWKAAEPLTGDANDAKRARKPAGTAGSHAGEERAPEARGKMADGKTAPIPNPERADPAPTFEKAEAERSNLAPSGSTPGFDPARGEGVMLGGLEAIKLIWQIVSPFIPTTAERQWKQALPEIETGLTASPHYGVLVVYRYWTGMNAATFEPIEQFRDWQWQYGPDPQTAYRWHRPPGELLEARNGELDPAESYMWFDRRKWSLFRPSE